MKNNKLIFVVVSIAIAIAVILIIFLLIVPTQCSKQQSLTTETETSITEETQQETVKETETRTTAETTVATTAKETTNTTATETTAAPKEAPTIKLEIYEGPTYSPADNVCYYRIKASVTGNPVPTIAFSKDDSDRTLGTSRCQINLYDSTETYTLIAKATNSEDYATDSITLSWGCELENQNPVISEITVMGTKYISRTYGLGVSASDPDGDSLTYNWTVTGGTIDDTSAQNINWTTPSTYGNYIISVTVSDGKGGEDSKSEDIYVHFYYDLLEEAESASWHNSTGDYHLWNVGLGDSRGFACYRTNITLEDDNIYPKVLEAHPQWRTFGYIAGDYPDMEIPGGARFTAEIGFIKGATGTDGANFNVDFVDTSYVVYHITGSGGYHAAYDGALDSLNFDLSSLAGKFGRIIIWVHAHNTSDQDWAVWVNPQITN